MSMWSATMPASPAAAASTTSRSTPGDGCSTSTSWASCTASAPSCRTSAPTAKAATSSTPRRWPGWTAGSGSALTSASKFAVVAMSEGLAMQLKPLGIGVTVLCPGFVRTRISESGRNRPERYGAARTPDPASPAGSAGRPARRTRTVRARPVGCRRAGAHRDPRGRTLRVHASGRCAPNWRSGLPPFWRRWTRRRLADGRARALGSRPRAGASGCDARRCAASFARPRAARRALGLPALLARRASQHAGHRQRRDRGGDRLRRRRARATIRVGAGGIMLPNHAPLVIAEQFGTLESLYPGRIDLGLGRAPGTDQLTLARAAPRPGAPPTRFPQDVLELQALLRPAASRARRCRPCRAPGSNVPLWILGSSLFGAQLAAALGLPLRLRLAFRARRADAGARDLPRALPAVRAARPALRDGRRQRDRRRHRRGGAAALHLAAAGVRQPAPRRAAASCSRRSTTSRRTGRRPRRRRRSADAGLLVRRLAGDGAARARARSSSGPAPTS